MRFSPKRTPDVKLGHITVLRYDFLLVTSFMFLHFLMFSIVFAKNEVIHQFEKTFLKIDCSLSSVSCIEIYVGLHPCRLIKFNHSIYSLQNQSVREDLIQC